MVELWYRAALIQLTEYSRAVLPDAVHWPAMRTYSRAWDCLLVAMILLYVLAWVWFPMTMAIWTASSFIATGIYVVVRLQLCRNARKGPQRLLSSCLIGRSGKCRAGAKGGSPMRRPAADGHPDNAK
jgi:hypothetical protein